MSFLESAVILKFSMKGVLVMVFSSLVIYHVTDNFDFGPSINLVALMLVLILLALAYVFQYGAELQKESDETL